MSIAISCQNVSKEFYEARPRSWRHFWLSQYEKIQAVNNINLTIHEHEVFGLLGPNGSGKSSLIRLLSTLLLPDQGQINILGFDVQTEAAKIRPLINRVSVEAAFFKRLSARENLRYAARIYNLDPKVGEERAGKVLERLGITGSKLTVPLENFSRGMQQKVAIARALMTEPQLLLLDEPTTGLDPKSKRDVQEYIDEMLQDRPMTILLTTHDMQEAENLCQRIAIIDRGEILATGTSAELQEQAGVASLEDAFVKMTGKTMEVALSE